MIGTCSTDDKVEFLKVSLLGSERLVSPERLVPSCLLHHLKLRFQSLGCDRPVNYSKEKLKDVLAREYKVFFGCF